MKGLLHIGYNEIQLLNTDHVTVIRAWPIKNIKACAQVCFLILFLNTFLAFRLFSFPVIDLTASYRNHSIKIQSKIKKNDGQLVVQSLEAYQVFGKMPPFKMNVFFSSEKDQVVLVNTRVFCVKIVSVPSGNKILINKRKPSFLKTILLAQTTLVHGHVPVKSLRLAYCQ